MSMRWTKITVIDESNSIIEEYPLDKKERHVKAFKMTRRRKITDVIGQLKMNLQRDENNEIIITPNPDSNSVDEGEIGLINDTSMAIYDFSTISPSLCSDEEDIFFTIDDGTTTEPKCF